MMKTGRAISLPPLITKLLEKPMHSPGFLYPADSAPAGSHRLQSPSLPLHALPPADRPRLVMTPSSPPHASREYGGAHSFGDVFGAGDQNKRLLQRATPAVIIDERQVRVSRSRAADGSSTAPRLLDHTV